MTHPAATEHQEQPTKAQLGAAIAFLCLFLITLATNYVLLQQFPHNTPTASVTTTSATDHQRP